jgi:hypothetical protein
MRVILRYVDGKPEWSENIPARAGHAGHGGELIRGDHGPVESQRQSQRAHKARQRAEKP